MGITILAGGCRQETDDGKVEEKRCNECFAQESCELAPRARELAQAIIHQWARTDQRKPPEAVPILYLEYPSAEPSGTVHLGHYNNAKRRFQAKAGRKWLPEEAVIAWMAVPQMPERVFDGQRAVERSPNLESPWERLLLEP